VRPAAAALGPPLRSARYPCRRVRRSRLCYDSARGPRSPCLPAVRLHREERSAQVTAKVVGVNVPGWCRAGATCGDCRRRCHRPVMRPNSSTVGSPPLGLLRAGHLGSARNRTSHQVSSSSAVEPRCRQSTRRPSHYCAPSRTPAARGGRAADSLRATVDTTRTFRRASRSWTSYSVFGMGF